MKKGREGEREKKSSGRKNRWPQVPETRPSLISQLAVTRPCPWRHVPSGGHTLTRAHFIHAHTRTRPHPHTHVHTYAHTHPRTHALPYLHTNTHVQKHTMSFLFFSLKSPPTPSMNVIYSRRLVKENSSLSNKESAGYH